MQIKPQKQLQGRERERDHIYLKAEANRIEEY